jgi:hypothetical protein
VAVIVGVFVPDKNKKVPLVLAEIYEAVKVDKVRATVLERGPRYITPPSVVVQI